MSTDATDVFTGHGRTWGEIREAAAKAGLSNLVLDMDMAKSMIEADNQKKLAKEKN